MGSLDIINKYYLRILMKNAEQEKAGSKMHLNTALCIITVGLAISSQVLRQRGITDFDVEISKGLTVVSSIATFASSRIRVWYYTQIVPGMEDYNKVPSVKRKEAIISALTAFSGLSQVFQ